LATTAITPVVEEEQDDNRSTIFFINDALVGL
jgi:hypothetical protein